MMCASSGRTPVMPSALSAPAAVLAFSMLSACSPAPPAEPLAPSYPYCSASEREAAVCEQLRRAVMIESDGKRVPLDVLKCKGGDTPVHITLARRDSGALVYDGRMSFSEAAPRAPMVLESIQPDIHEWPCTDDSCRIMRELAPGTRVAAPILQQCPGAPKTETAEVVVPLPPANAQTCTGGLSLGWCVDPGDGTERYEIYEVSWLPFTRRMAIVEAREGIVSVRTNGGALRRLPKEDVDVLIPSLDELWSGPRQMSKSCRDGTGTVIYARRPGAWRIIEVYNCVGVRGFKPVLRAPVRPR